MARDEKSICFDYRITQIKRDASIFFSFLFFLTASRITDIIIISNVSAPAAKFVINRFLTRCSGV